MKNRIRSGLVQIAGGFLAFAAVSQSAAASSILCVNSGKAGCFSKIGAAVNAASAGDTIRVAPGYYTEGDIVIGGLCR